MTLQRRCNDIGFPLVLYKYYTKGSMTYEYIGPDDKVLHLRSRIRIFFWSVYCRICYTKWIVSSLFIYRLLPHLPKKHGFACRYIRAVWSGIRYPPYYSKMCQSRANALKRLFGRAWWSKYEHSRYARYHIITKTHQYNFDPLFPHFS